MFSNIFLEFSSGIIGTILSTESSKELKSPNGFCIIGAATTSGSLFATIGASLLSGSLGIFNSFSIFFFERLLF